MLYISGTDVRVTRWAKYTTIAFLVGQIIANLLAFIIFYAQCGTRIDLLWGITPAKLVLRRQICMNVEVQKILGYGLGAFNCLTDAYMTILPAILIEHSRLSLKRKIGLAFLLCLSVLALAAAIVKTYEAKALSEVSDYSCKHFNPSPTRKKSNPSTHRRTLRIRHLDRHRTQHRHHCLLHPAPPPPAQHLPHHTQLSPPPSPAREPHQLRRHQTLRLRQVRLRQKT